METVYTSIAEVSGEEKNLQHDTCSSSEKQWGKNAFCCQLYNPSATRSLMEAREGTTAVAVKDGVY